VAPVDTSRLMVLRRDGSPLEHRRFADILEYLRPGDLLVANETRVIPARLAARKVPTGGKVELLLLARRGPRTWESLVKGRRVDVGQVVQIVPADGTEHARPGPQGTVREITASGGRLIEFDSALLSHLDELGAVPLPPYIHEPLADPQRYQTVYAESEGSVAAPTAGLHFTPALLSQAKDLGVEWATVLLHIGLDTFRPVHEQRIEDHVIHSEYCRLTKSTSCRINCAIREGRRVIAVGTTSVRVLETAARGVEVGVRPWEGATDLYIYPGFDFRVVDGLITNFHLPRSSLLMLVSAFAGRERVLAAYREAVQRRYRFYSFGDAMLML